MALTKRMGALDTTFRCCHLSIQKRFGMLLALCIVIILIQIYIVTRVGKKLQGPPLLEQNLLAKTMFQQSESHLGVQMSTLLVSHGHQESNLGEQTSTLLLSQGLTSSSSEQNISNRTYKTIMLYNLDGTVLGKTFGNEHMTRCDVHKCNMIQAYDVSKIGSLKPDAVVFQANRIPKFVHEKGDLREPVFIFVSMEPPGNLTTGNLATRQISERWKGRFNWTMTYRLNSDIPIPHGAILPINSKSMMKYGVPYIISDFHGKHKMPKNPNKNYHQIFQSKRFMVSWIQNKCSTDSKSEDYVKLLQKSLKVDIYGNCSSKNRQTLSPSSIANNYKFLLVFEDSMCVDYISQQVFSWYTKDIILILRGARNYDKQLPAGTYIDTNNFSSPKELGKYLSSIAKKEKLYTNFLRKKDRYTVIQAKGIAQLALCEICKRLNRMEEYQKKSVEDVNKWWRREQHCVYPYDIDPFKPPSTD